MKYLLLLACLLLSACAADDQSQDPLTSATAQGKVVVINYWAEWCKPCLTELPELNEFNHQQPGVQVLGVNYDGETGEALEALINKFSIEFPILADDPAAQLGLERPQVLPTTLVLDVAGEVAEILIGPQTAESLEAVTAPLLTD